MKNAVMHAKTLTTSRMSNFYYVYEVYALLQLMQLPKKTLKININKIIPIN